MNWQELAIHEVKSILDHSSVANKPLNQTIIAQQVAADISAKVAKYKEILAQSASAIESLYNIELGPSSSPATAGQEQSYQVGIRSQGYAMLWWGGGGGRLCKKNGEKGRKRERGRGGGKSEEKKIYLWITWETWTGACW